MVDSQKERFTHIVSQVSSGSNLKAPTKVLCMGFIFVLANCEFSQGSHHIFLHSEEHSLLKALPRGNSKKFHIDVS